jgi:hypothetical protein
MESMSFEAGMEKNFFSLTSQLRETKDTRPYNGDQVLLSHHSKCYPSEIGMLQGKNRRYFSFD